MRGATVTPGYWRDPEATEQVLDAFYQNMYAPGFLYSVDRAFVATVLEHFTEGDFVELSVCLAQFTGMGSLFSMLGIPSPVPAS